MQDGSEPRFFDTGGKKIRAVAVIHDQDGLRRVVVGGADAGMTIWDPGSRRSVGRFPYPGPAQGMLVRALAVKEADKNTPELLAAGDSHGRVTVWETATGHKCWSWTNERSHSGPVRTLAWVPTLMGMRLASGGSDGRIHLWSSNDGAAAGSFDGHSGPVAALAALSTPDEQVLTRHLFVSGGADGTIQTWDPDKPGTPGSTLSAHPSWVRALVRLEHDGSLYVVSGGDDGSVRQWIVSDGRLISTRHEGHLSGFGDRPAQYDLLDRRPLQEVLESLLRLPIPPKAGEGSGQAIAAPGESEGDRGVATYGPRVVAVQGPWGAGKTSLMRRIYAKLCEHHQTCKDWNKDHDCTALHSRIPDIGPPPTAASDAATRSRFTVREAAHLTRRESGQDRLESKATADDPTRVLPVWFDPWAHEHAHEVWAGLTQQIIEAAKPAINGTHEPGGARTDALWQRYWFIRNLNRLDGAEMRRMLLRRIWLPLLPVFVAAVPLVAALVSIGRLWLAVIGYGALVGTIAAIAAARWWGGDARAYLPADLMKGPVLSGAFAAPTGGEPTLHDPLYRARSGYLYLVQHDVRELVADLAEGGYQLVVFIDDLDRCLPDTVAEVFEAVNVFLTADFPSAKFLIGLDPSVVAGRLAEVFHAEESRLWQDPDDPSPGWSFLRKLCQLTITLPQIREAHTARLMRLHTLRADKSANSGTSPQPAGPGDGAATAEGPVQRTTRPGGEGQLVHQNEATAPRPSATPPDPARAEDDGSTAQGGGVADPSSEKLLFEGDPVIRDHLRALMALRPHQSVRETKRLLTLWSFYLALLRLLLPTEATSSAQFGRDVLTFAEILTRWPALTPAFGPAAGAESGLRDLVQAANSGQEEPPAFGPVARAKSGLRHLIQAANSGQEEPWHTTLRELELDTPDFTAPCENLRKMLTRYGNDEVAYYAECVL